MHAYFFPGPLMPLPVNMVPSFNVMAIHVTGTPCWMPVLCGGVPALPFVVGEKGFRERIEQMYKGLPKQRRMSWN